MRLDLAEHLAKFVPVKQALRKGTIICSVKNRKAGVLGRPSCGCHLPTVWFFVFSSDMEGSLRNSNKSVCAAVVGLTVAMPA